MGTRGAFGVRIDGQDKITYNHFDSYPEGLGAALAEQLASMVSRKGGIDALCEAALAVRVLRDGESLSASERVRVEKYRDGGVDDGKSLYALTRRLQGDLRAILDDARVMLDGADFLADSVFCEWAYVANLDSGRLEIYRGFQSKPHAKGRYGEIGKPRGGYWPVALVGELPITKQLAQDFDAWSKEFQKDDD